MEYISWRLSTPNPKMLMSKYFNEFGGTDVVQTVKNLESYCKLLLIFVVELL